METQVQAAPQMKRSIRFSPYCVSVRHFLRVFSLILGCTLLSLSSTVYANVNSVTASPSSASLPVRGTATVNITWQVSRTEPPPSTTGPVIITRTVSSPTATLQIGGATVATVGGLISTTSSLLQGQSGTVRINDRLILSPALARRIADSPAGSVRIIRTFSDTQTSGSGQVRVFSGGGNSGSLTVRRIDLAFENRARTDVVYKDESIRAIVDLTFRSSGILRGEWRLVDPTASLGSSGGRVLQIVQKSLVSSGEGRTRIISPPLPTNKSGLHLLAFFIQGTDTALETPVLRYFVLDNQGNSLATAAPEIKVFSPGNGADLNRNTVFSWQAVQGAHAYQIELFNKGDNVPITGKLVHATDLKLSLSAVSLQWLHPGYEYSWQVRAFGAGGAIIGKSALQTLARR